MIFDGGRFQMDRMTAELTEKQAIVFVKYSRVLLYARWNCNFPGNVRHFSIREDRNILTLVGKEQELIKSKIAGIIQKKEYRACKLQSRTCSVYCLRLKRLPKYLPLSQQAPNLILMRIHRILFKIFYKMHTYSGKFQFCCYSALKNCFLLLNLNSVYSAHFCC